MATKEEKAEEAEEPAAAPEASSKGLASARKDIDEGLLEETTLNEKAMLDAWVHDQQMAWLKESEQEMAVDLTELRRRVDARVKKIKTGEVNQALAQLRSEFGMFLLFSVLFCFVLSVFMLGDTYKFTSAMRARIIGDEKGGQNQFDEITTHDDVWDFLANRLSPNVYPQFDGEVKDPTTTMIGAIQLRQTRVAKTERCAVPPIYEASLASCHPPLGKEDTEIYGRLGEFAAKKICISLACDWFYTYNLRSDLNASTATQQLRELQQAGWIDMQTRIVKALFTYYNPAADMFCAVSLEFEFLASGGVDPASYFRVINPQRHVMSLTAVSRFFPPSVWQWVMLAFEACFWLLVMASFVGEVRWFCMNGFYRWFVSVWHVTDFLNYLSLVVVFSMRAFLMLFIGNLDFHPTPDVYPEFYSVANLVFLIQNTLSIGVIFTFLKTVKYLQVAPHISWVTRSFASTGHEIAGHLISVAAIFQGYVMALHLTFGQYMFDYSTVLRCWNNIFSIIIGEFDYDAMRETENLVGLYLFLSFMFVYLILIYNMVVAILATAFERVREEKAEGKRREPALLALRYRIEDNYARLKKSFLAHELQKMRTRAKRLVDAKVFKRMLKLEEQKQGGKLSLVERARLQLEAEKVAAQAAETAGSAAELSASALAAAALDPAKDRPASAKEKARRVTVAADHVHGKEKAYRFEDGSAFRSVRYEAGRAFEQSGQGKRAKALARFGLGKRSSKRFARAAAPGMSIEAQEEAEARGAALGAPAPSGSTGKKAVAFAAAAAAGVGAGAGSPVAGESSGSKKRGGFMGLSCAELRRAAAEPEEEEPGVAQLAEALTSNRKLAEVRMALRTSDDAPARTLARNLLVLTKLPTTQALSTKELQRAMLGAQTLVRKAVNDAKRTKDPRGIDLRVGGILGEWVAQMDAMDDEIAGYSNTLDEVEHETQQRAASLAATMQHLRRHSIMRPLDKTAEKNARADAASGKAIGGAKAIGGGVDPFPSPAGAAGAPRPTMRLQMPPQPAFAFDAQPRARSAILRPPMRRGVTRGDGAPPFRPHVRSLVIERPTEAGAATGKKGAVRMSVHAADISDADYARAAKPPGSIDDEASKPPTLEQRKSMAKSRSINIFSLATSASSGKGGWRDRDLSALSTERAASCYRRKSIDRPVLEPRVREPTLAADPRGVWETKTYSATGVDLEPPAAAEASEAAGASSSAAGASSAGAISPAEVQPDGDPPAAAPAEGSSRGQMQSQLDWLARQQEDGD